MVDARSTLTRLQTRFGPMLEVHLERTLLASNLDMRFARMMAYQFGFTDEHLRHVRIATGKRFRPLLALLACEGTRGAWQDALPVATAIELLHNFSLIHDDIEDGDPVRHHLPTVWSVWGEAQAINVGDALFGSASGVILTAHPEPSVCLELARAFQRTSMQLTEGQYLDMSFERRMDVTPDEYLHMIERKTAALISFSLWSGAVVGGATTDTQIALGDVGASLGKAFQIRDDIAGIWAVEAETGKQPATDLVNRKKTLPVVLGFSKATGSDRQRLIAFFENRSNDVDAVRDILEQIGTRTAAETASAVHVHRALEALQLAELHAETREQLVALAVGLGG